MVVRVLVDVDVELFGQEYGEQLPATKVRERITADVVEQLTNAPYADAVKIRRAGR